MNAQTFNQIVNPVLAVLSIQKYNHRNGKQEFTRRKQQPKNFDSLFHSVCETADDMLLNNDPGCYGKDAQPVVRIVSSFNRTL